MRILILAILLSMFSCKKTENKITFELRTGSGDVILTDGNLVTDFQSCTEGWSMTRKARPQTHYSIQVENGYNTTVVIKYNGHTVSTSRRITHYTTP